MSVPLPSPSWPISASRPVPTPQPQPSTSAAGAAGAAAHSPASPSSPSASARRAGTTRSVGFHPAKASVGDGDNWRERDREKSGASGSPGARNGAGRARPERTVGGFEKRDVKVSPKAAGSGLKESKEAKESADSKAALSHVPCRFFKAGACTAGANCPFSHDVEAKREICQWFLKGNCKFGHKCALAHVRPGETMAMDRRNKKAEQQQARERSEGKKPEHLSLSQSQNGNGNSNGALRPEPSPRNQGEGGIAAPVPIKSALSSSLQTPPVGRMGSSPLRDPIGPPPPGAAGTSPGFAHGRSVSGPGGHGFASSPSRPSPLSAPFTSRQGITAPLKPGSVAAHSPLRPPATAAPNLSSSFSHTQSPLRDTRPALPMSASFADGSARHLWARHDELSPARRAMHQRMVSHEDVFQDDDDEEHGEDLLPSSLSDLLTPAERARRKSRQDSNESFGQSPGRPVFLPRPNPNGERLAQSAGPTVPNYLASIWSTSPADPPILAASPGRTGEFAFGPSTAQHTGHRQSLLTQQRQPAPAYRAPLAPDVAGLGSGLVPHFTRPIGDPSSPSARALQEHAPGQSVPGGVATALSRLHLQGARSPSGLAGGLGATAAAYPGARMSEEHAREEKPDEREEDELFTMDG